MARANAGAPANEIWISHLENNAGDTPIQSKFPKGIHSKEINQLGIRQKKNKARIKHTKSEATPCQHPSTATYSLQGAMRHMREQMHKSHTSQHYSESKIAKRCSNMQKTSDSFWENTRKRTPATEIGE